MGGLGSGRWRSLNRRQVVEACYFIAATDLPAFAGLRERFVFPVRRHGGEIAGHLPCQWVRGVGGLAFSYDLRDYGAAISQSIQLATTQARSGGSRQCFLCPCDFGDDGCEESCRKLYLPPNGCVFGCRTCHQLSYESQQRRSERLARTEELTANVVEEATEFMSRENVGFNDRLRMMRRMSYAIADLFETLGNTSVRRRELSGC